MKKLHLNPHPCDTCPYRKDVPSGIWDESEYRKLPAWDDPMAFAGVFHCHNQTASRQTVCRGWMEVHQDNLHVRICMAMQIEFNERKKAPTTVPLHTSGLAANESRYQTA